MSRLRVELAHPVTERDRAVEERDQVLDNSLRAMGLDAFADVGR